MKHAKKCPPPDKAALPILSLMLACLLPVTNSQAAAGVPSPPPSAHSEVVADALELNGKPLHIHRILSADKLPALLHHYQREFDGRVAEARVGNTVILSHEGDGQFITVMLKPLGGGGGHEILVAQSPLHASVAPYPAPDVLPGGWVLPADTRLLSTLTTRDPGRHTTQLVFSNAHSLAINRERLRQQLARQGLLPEPLQQARLDDPARQAWLEHYSGPGGEARVILMRNASQTESILTLIRSQP